MSASPTPFQVRIDDRKIAVDLPHFVFATGIAAWSGWFCWNSWRSSPDVENLILIVPVSAGAVLLYLFVAASCFKIIDIDQTEGSGASPREPLVRADVIKVAVSMALLAAFVVAGPTIGFDVASFTYMLAMMAFLGERRILVLLLVPLVFSVTVIYCFSSLLGTPLPLFFGTFGL